MNKQLFFQIDVHSSATLFENSNKNFFHKFSILNFKTELNRKQTGQLLFWWPY